MIDFHTHILPNVDDGAKSIEETIELIKEATAVGFDAIILTPHYIEKYYETPKNEISNLITKVKNITKKSKIKINLYQANEIYISENIISLLEKEKISTINNTKYVLFELPFTEKILNLYDIIYKLQQYNLIPILAHPERCKVLQNNFDIIYDLTQRGVLMQVNYGSFIGKYGFKAKIIAKKMLKNNMVHFLGTDVHRDSKIYKKIPKILRKLEKAIGKGQLYNITTGNPKAVLKNKDIF